MALHSSILSRAHEQFVEKYASITLPLSITIEEVRQHNKKEDCFVVVNGKVFDVTFYLAIHPGGFGLLFRNAGADATKDFEAGFHSKNARIILNKFYVGELKGSQQTLRVAPVPTNRTLGPPSRTAAPTFPMNMRNWKGFKLVQIEPVTHNTNALHFEVENGQKLNISLGCHISVGFTHELLGDDVIFRNYTPILDEAGRFILLVKVYEKGVVSRMLHNAKIGDTVLMRGPFGSFSFQSTRWKSVGMICAGTGVTPMIQILRALVTKPCSISLLSANRTEKDILLREQLEQWKKQSQQQFDTHYILSEPSDTWTGLKGRISEEIIKQCMPTPSPNTKILVCGSTEFNNMIQQHLENLFYTSSMYHIFDG